MRVRLVMVFMLAMLSGCASLRPAIEPPQVTVTGFRMLPSADLAPRFEIALRVANPNRIALRPEGLVYSVTLEEYRLLNGVTNELPVIEGYTSTDLVLVVTADLIQGVRLLSELMARPRDEFTYRLDARLDLGSLVPDVKVSEGGTLSLSPRSPPAPGH